MVCYQCGEITADNQVSMAYSLPGLGEFCWCTKCLPIPPPEEIVKSFDDFLNPAKENPEDGK